MWRWLSGFPRAIRQQCHGPRASASGAVREEEVEQCRDVPNKRNLFERHDLKLFACSNESKGEQKSKHGPDQDKWYKYYTKDFCSFISGNHKSLEALGWGAAVVLGIHFSKCPVQQHKHHRRSSIEAAKKCILWEVALAIPNKVSKSVVGSLSIVDADVTRHSVTSSSHQINAETETVGAVLNKEKEDTDDPLHKVMNEFEGICRKYTGIGKNIQGLQQAAKTQMKKAVSSWIDASHLGYTKAQFNLGLCYETGQGVEVNLKKAENYYKLAAEDGHPQALYNLALLYLKGEGCIEKDVRLAIELLHKAAESGLGQAQTYLGVYYTEEESLDLEKAAVFFKAASEQNDPEAQYFLGVCYEQGWGVEVNECKSAELYSLAAASGHDGALYSLAVFHEQALGGIPEDKASAIDLYEKAAEAGNEQAKFQLDRIRAEAAVEEYKYMYPHYKEYRNYPSLYGPKIENQEEDKSLKLNVSVSSPSLTDYVRNHLASFTLSSHNMPFKIEDSLSIMRNKSVEKDALSFVIQSSSDGDFTRVLEPLPLWQQSEWKPQYGSPRKSADSPSRVSFSIGVDEDDLQNLYALDAKVDSLPPENHDSQIHHFCSFIQKNSTMPNLCVSCN